MSGDDRVDHFTHERNRPPRGDGMKHAQDAPQRRKRRRKAGDLAALKRIMWRGLEAAEGILDDPEADRGELLKACNALASLGGAYARVTESADLIPRLEALEAAAQQQGGRAAWPAR